MTGQHGDMIGKRRNTDNVVTRLTLSDDQEMENRHG